MPRSVSQEKINRFVELFRGVPIPSRGLKLVKKTAPGIKLSKIEELCRADENLSYMDAMSRIIFDRLKERKDGEEKSVVRIGDTKFKSQLIYGPSNSGLSTILMKIFLRNTHDAPSVFIVQNENHVEYLKAIAKKLNPSLHLDKDFGLITGKGNGKKNKESETTTSDQVRLMTSELQGKKIIFVTQHGVHSNSELVRKVVANLNVRDFFYDDIHNMKNDSNDDQESEKTLEEEQEKKSHSYTAMLELLAAARPRANQLARIVGSLNFPQHKQLKEDIFVRCKNTIAKMFPEYTRNELPKKSVLGSNSFATVEPLPFIPLERDDNGAYVATVSRVMSGANDETNKVVVNGEEKSYKDILLETLDKVFRLKGKTIVFTQSDKAVQNVKQIFEEKGLADRVSSSSSAPTSRHRLIDLARKPKDEDHFYITNSSINQLHLPPGNVDNFVYLRGVSSSIVLARDFSIASDSPGTRLFAVLPHGEDKKERPIKHYRFINVRNYRSVKPRERKEQRVPKGFEDVPVKHINYVKGILENTNIRDRSDSWNALLSFIIRKSGDDRPLEDSTIFKSFVDSSFQSGDYKPMSKAQIRSVLLGDEYHPRLFRAFLSYLFNSSFMETKGIREDFLARGKKVNLEEFGIEELTLKEMIRSHSRLTGVENLEEARLVMENFSPIHQFHLGIMDDFNIPADYPIADRLEMMISLMKYLRVDSELLQNEIGLDKDELEAHVNSYLSQKGLASANALDEIGRLLVDSSLLTHIFENFKINHVIPLKKGLDDYHLELKFTGSKFYMKLNEGEVNDS